LLVTGERQSEEAISVARWRFSPPDLPNAGGFESRLAVKKYFWWTPNFWRISGGFDQFCMGLFLSRDFWSLYLQKKNLFLTF
jgi:hypothetical protein